jgi:hypothetical protein
MCQWAVRAHHCWRWCGGWNPALWPLYAALHEVPDWPLLIELLEVIRDYQHG